MTDSSSSLAHSPLATSKSRAPLATSLVAPFSQLSTGSIPSSSADVDDGGSWMADASSGNGLTGPGGGGGGASALVPPATGSDDDCETGTIPGAAEIVVVKETQSDARIGFPSSAATVAVPTVSVESAEAVESPSIAAATSTESRDSNRHVTTSVDGDMTSSVGGRQEVEPGDIRAFSRGGGGGGGRESKFVQTDNVTADDDVSFRCLPTVARQLQLLRLNVSRLLSRRGLLLPGLSVDRLEDIDSALEKLLLEEFIDDDGGQRTSEGRRIQTKTWKQECKVQVTEFKRDLLLRITRLKHCAHFPR